MLLLSTRFNGATQADKASKEELRAKLLAYGYKLRCGLSVCLSLSLSVCVLFTLVFVEP